MVALCKIIADELSINLSKQLKPLISKIDEFLNTIGSVRIEESQGVKEYNNTRSGALKLFDASFNSVCLEEGLYIVQLNVRMRSEGEDSSIRRVLLKNKHYFTGSSSKPLKSIEFKTYVRQEVFELYDNRDYIDDFLRTEYWKERASLTDMVVEQDRNVSISFIQAIDTIRESDGYDELRIKDWHLVVQYNIDDEVEIPLILEPLDSDVQGNYIY